MKTFSPVVTVVTPTKNRLKLLCETMDSVQRQTFDLWEHLIIDDGSDDRTAEEVLRRALTDSRIRYMARLAETSGANACRNQGLAAASADLIVFLDSDDVLEPTCLAGRVDIMQHNRDIDFAVWQMGAFTESLNDWGYVASSDLIGDDLLGFLFFEIPWQTAAVIWRRQALNRLGGFDEGLPSWQDIDLHVRAIAAGCRYLRSSRIDYHMRWHGAPDKVSIKQRRAPDHLKSAEHLMLKFERVLREGPGMTWLRQRALCSLYFFIAECWIDAGRPADSLRCWALARKRKLASNVFYAMGVSLLALQVSGQPGKRLGRRISHKWKGWMRMRTNPELVPTQK
jgi:glycosyltransferase involved in cell wall biosynthesis